MTHRGASARSFGTAPLAGVILFGAEHILSPVHERVTGNCSTILLGRTNAAETVERGYRFMNSNIKAAARLDKGQPIFSHAFFRQSVKNEFQLLACKQPGWQQHPEAELASTKSTHT